MRTVSCCVSRDALTGLRRAVFSTYASHVPWCGWCQHAFGHSSTVPVWVCVASLIATYPLEEPFASMLLSRRITTLFLSQSPMWIVASIRLAMAGWFNALYA